MKIFLVGGAVRDKLLGLPVDERDWVVVGATPEDMTELGFKQVGKEFPVFLHPESNEEYALARTERKTGPGYHGFEFDTATDVSLEDDLKRRDLTINAIAEDADGTLVDPFGGQTDLEERRLKHISDAFAEDPVRVLRVARFAARFAEHGFEVAPETLALMRQMTEAGEADALTPERVWIETEKALSSSHPSVYFRVLRDCTALAKVFPEIDTLFGVPQPERWHPEIDTGEHTLMVLEQAAVLSDDPVVRFAALVHDLGKGATPPEQWPSHPGHEARSVELVRALSERLKIPNAYRNLAEKVARFHGHVHRADELRPATKLDVLEKTDAFRRPQEFERLLTACEADYRGRTGFEQRDYPQAGIMRNALAAAVAISIDDIDSDGLEGAEIGERMRQKRIEAIRS